MFLAWDTAKEGDRIWRPEARTKPRRRPLTAGWAPGHHGEVSRRITTKSSENHGDDDFV